jgi:hypothetical protein
VKNQGKIEKNNKNAGCLFDSRKGGKMKNSIGLEFSPAGKRKHDRILARPRENARKKSGILKPTRMK